MNIFPVSVESEMPGYVEAKYILGHAYLKNGQPDKAKDAFLKVVNAPENEWTKSAKWHLVLASLQSGDEQQAIQFLDEIIESNYDEYVDLAKRLKADLESPWRVLVFD
ncbi:MAG: hypothetical protein D6714_08800 [Bacteroidetes bacterium]|nr:MAG: hypothetical protein D6714_08800 [Bacteroidota bacterium]